MVTAIRPTNIVLLTRPYGDSLITAKNLNGYGYDCLIDPMLTVDHYDLSTIHFVMPTRLQGCILTSKRATKALSFWNIPKITPLYVVGAATAETVYQQGYHNVIQGSGDGLGLLSQLLSQTHAQLGTMVYFSGEERRFDLESPLLDAGYDIKCYIIYSTIKAPCLQVATLSALRHKHITTILYYSPKSARRFNELALDLGHLLVGVTAICLSTAVAAELTLPFAKVMIAEQPHEKALIKTLIYRMKFHDY